MSLNQGEAGNFARILTESLPYIQRFTGKTFVIKFGGNAMTDEELQESCLLYTSPSPRDKRLSRMPSSA